MINLKVRTEFSFREVYGPLPKVLAATQGPIGICDRSGTWGHVEFDKACKEVGRKAIFGVELAVVENMKLREKQGVNWMSFLAINQKGLSELYELVSLSTMEPQNYYHPRVDYDVVDNLSGNIIILSGPFPNWKRVADKQDNFYVELNPTSGISAIQIAQRKKLPLVATSDNFYPSVTDRPVYEVISGMNRLQRSSAMHILNSEEWKLYWPDAPMSALSNQKYISDLCNVELPKATLIHFKNMKSLRSMCEKAAPKHKINLKEQIYADRLKRELDLIEEKQFTDYFYLVADIVQFAKKHMLVGPARGSSCGSLVCYLLGITDINPIPFDLLFERFIDVNRKDLPDIDIDFQDDRREMVFNYIRRTYGEDCVARLGTIMRYKAKSTIGDTAKMLGIPQWEVDDLKASIIERSTGDARAAFCVMDTFEQLEIGKAILAKYPQMAIASEIENHARGSGQHAAGICVCTENITNYCSVDHKNGAVQIDKHDAEVLNLVKIDALGLRTLSVIQDTLDQIGWTREQMIDFPLNYKPAFDIINARRFAGIFQFEGYALQSLCSQMQMENFEDVAAMTALARPGPLECGGANEYIKRRTGEHKPTPLHPLIDSMTKISYGIVIYQEQVMQIARIMGKLSWDDVSTLRKAMSKSFGKEYFDQFWVRFRDGAASQGVKEEDAELVWHNINTMGSWSFNRSHAIAYGMVSYWTMVLKSKFPLEYASACLRNSRDDDQAIQLLKELKREGFAYRAFDMELSQKNWSVHSGVLIGGLTSIKGIGEKTADDIIARKKRKEPLTNGQKNKLANATTPFDVIFQCEELWGHIRENPEKFNIVSSFTNISQITEEDEGEFLIFGKIKTKDMRDLNDPNAVKKRDGRRINGQSLVLNLVVEDDTGNIRLRVDRHHYITLGIPIIEEAKIGDWYIWKGIISKGFRSMKVRRWRRLTGNKLFEKTPESQLTLQLTPRE
jgi:DNA-directed DNA polymerase III PolC